MKSLQLQNPHLLVTVGLPGSGKSFFASQFSETFNTPLVDFDYYRRIAGDQAGSQLASHTLDLITKTNQTVLVEGFGQSRKERRVLSSFAHKHEYAVLYIWVQTDIDTAQQRIVYSKGSKTTSAEFEQRVSQFEPLHQTEPSIVISGKHTHSTQAKTVLRRLVSSQPTRTRPVQNLVPPPRRRIMG